MTRKNKRKAKHHDNNLLKMHRKIYKECFFFSFFITFFINI